MTGFVQIIQFRTTKLDEVRALGEDFRKARATGDGPSPTRITAAEDRDNPGQYVNIVEFASYEEAMANSEREDTSAFAGRMMELCDGPPTFLNLNVVESHDLD